MVRGSTCGEEIFTVDGKERSAEWEKGRREYERT